MNFKKWAGVGVAAALAFGGVSACGSDEKAATAVCFDEDGDRLPDSACQNNDGSGNEWLWFAAGMLIPRMGQNYHGLSQQPYTAPPRGYSHNYGGAPTNGGTAPARPYSGSTATPKPSATVSPKPSAKPSTKPSAPKSTTKPKAPAQKAKPPSFSKPKSGGSFGKSGGFSGGTRRK